MEGYGGPAQPSPTNAGKPVAVAIAEGAEAGVAINKALLRREGLCE
jgi:hypothetical protein